MGFSGSGICLSDQNNLRETDHLGFLLVPSLGFSDKTSVQELLPDQDLEAKCLETRNCSSVKKEEEEEEEEEYYCKTPTRLDQILPAVAQICPPAPRKPKAVPSRSLKVRNSYRSRRMILLNVSREIESLFNPISLGNKIKKARHI